MMRKSFDPTKEEWRADLRHLVVVPYIGSIMATFYATDPYGPPADTIARARLATAAPDMARVLLAIEWHHGECISCFVMHGHAPDCALDAALRRAGVR